jgi:hypothetical protein
LLGHWKNFDELESNLSLDELMALIEFTRKKDYDDKMFLAKMNGLDVDNQESETVERTSDILVNQGYAAQQEGFGINEGLGYIELGG